MHNPIICARSQQRLTPSPTRRVGDLLSYQKIENPAGLDYLLEAAVAREVLQVWASWRQGRHPTAEETASAVIHYAQQDAYEPVQ